MSRALELDLIRKKVTFTVTVQPTVCVCASVVHATGVEICTF